MEKNIKKILEELYEIDGSLKEKENDLVKIINSMLNLKPNIKIDENFKEDLRNIIERKIRTKKLESYEKPNKLTFFQMFSYIFG
jgi:hypothetical protein